ncbi:MAG: site-specific integrase [Steroidobacteraceae bacterium]
MATIRKHRNLWQAQIRRRGHRPVAKSFRLKSDAEAWARQRESEIERGLFANRDTAERTLIADILARYGNEVSPSKACFKSDLGRLKHLSRFFGCLTLATISSAHLAEYRDARLEQVSPQSVRHELNLLGRVLKVAMVEWGYVLPYGIPQVRKPTMPLGRSRRLTQEEQHRLFSALTRNPRARAFVEFALETGMRRGEIAAMQWAHVALDLRVLNIPITKTGIPRDVPLSPRAIAVLENLPGPRKGPVWELAAASMSQAFERACVRAGLTDLRFHDLRHEAASRLFEHGLNTMEVASITGHRSVQMLQRYTHLRAADLAVKLAG